MEGEINKIKEINAQFIIKDTPLENNFKSIDAQYVRRVKYSEHLVFMHSLQM